MMGPAINQCRVRAVRLYRAGGISGAEFLFSIFLQPLVHEGDLTFLCADNITGKL